MRDVIRQGRPKCLACQVTVSPRRIRPELTPPITRSPLPAIEAVCVSISRETSNTRRGGAAMAVLASKRVISTGYTTVALSHATRPQWSSCDCELGVFELRQRLRAVQRVPTRGLRQLGQFLA